MNVYRLPDLSRHEPECLRSLRVPAELHLPLAMVVIGLHDLSDAVRRQSIEKATDEEAAGDRVGWEPTGPPVPLPMPPVTM